MTTKQKTVVVTGASQGIGAAIANLFLDRGYNVVANSRNISRKTELQRSENLALVDGDIALATTAEKIIATAVKRFGSLGALVNNAGIFFPKPFTEYTPEDFRSLSSTNLGRLHLHDPTGGQADARAEERRQRSEHHSYHRRSSARGVHCICPDDHQRRYQRNLT